MSPFRFESSCARDGGMWWIILHRGGPYLVVLSSGCGEFLLLWVILQRERHHDHIWIFEYSIFLWRQFRGGVMPLYGKWVCIWIICFPPSPLGFLGCIKLITPYYSQVHGVMTYIIPSPFFAIFFHTLLNIILVSNNHTFTISFSILIYLPICAILLSSYFYDLVYYYRWCKKWTWKFKFS